MGSYAGADIVDDDICNPRKLGDKISRHAGVFRAVPVNNTYRHGFIGSVTQGIFHSFSKCADGFLPSPGSAVRHQISGLENMINWESKDKDTLALIKYTADEDKLEKVLENPQVIKTPVVRNGRASTLGYQPDIWKVWE